MASLLARLRHPFGTPSVVVPVLRLAGVIGGSRGLTSSGLNLSTVAGLIDKAFAIKAAPAVALSINSPGGSPVQSALIAARIRELAAENEKPVLGFVEDVAASGGYWLACAADEIFADPSSIVGSIGVVSAGFGLHEAIGRIGVERRVHTAGDRKWILDPFAPEKTEDVAKLRAVQDEIHDSFKDYVRTRRGDRLASAGETDLFNGEFWTGQMAETLGLIDGIGHLRPVLRARFGDKVRPRVIAPRPGLMRRLRLAGMSPQAGAADLAEGLLTGVEERLYRQRYGL